MMTELDIFLVVVVVCLLERGMMAELLRRLGRGLTIEHEKNITSVFMAR
jgi:hypothetical protein